MKLKPTQAKGKILLSILALVFTSCLYAQIPQIDVVYLKNGTFLKGKIIELIPGENLKITLSACDTLVVRLDSVKLIRKENAPPVSVIVDEDEVKEGGYVFITELNFGLGVLEGQDRYRDSPQSQYSIALSVFNGFRFSPIILLGLGTSFEAWNTRFFIPFYIDFRANFLRNDNSPFIYLNTGYSLGWKSGDAGVGMGGAMAGIGIGAKFRINNKNIMVVSLGYHFQQTRQYAVNFGVTSKSTLDAHLMNLKVGLIF